MRPVSYKTSLKIRFKRQTPHSYSSSIIADFCISRNPPGSRICLLSIVDSNVQGTTDMHNMGPKVPEPQSSSLPPRPDFRPLRAHEMSDGQVEYRIVVIPPRRYTPLKKVWLEIYDLVHEQMKIDIMANLEARKVVLRTMVDTPDVSNLQKCADFVRAFMLGFDVADAVSLLRVDEHFVETFTIKDVKTSRGDYMSRAIARLTGNGGKRKLAIENATKTRIVIENDAIHILGALRNIWIARDSLCRLILGSPSESVSLRLIARL